MNKKFFLIINISINIFIILSLIVMADEIPNSDTENKKISRSEMSGYLETGKRSTALDYEEEDSDADYSYTNYQFKFKQDISSRLSYDLSSFQYKKDYDENDIFDNESKIFKTNWSYYIDKQKEKSLKLDMKFQYREKDYYNSPEKEYTQFIVLPSLKFKQENIYAVSLSCGVNSYKYIAKDQNDQFKYSAKLDFYRYFIEKKFMLSGYEDVEYLDHKQTDRDRIKYNHMLGLDYVFEYPYINKIETNIKWGKRDTKDDDDRDDDSDYGYSQYDIKTIHKITGRLKTYLKYEYFKKDYNVLALDHNGFYILNGYQHEIQNDRDKRYWLDFDIMQKNVKYNEKTEFDYTKTAANIKFNYDRKKNWKTSVGLENNFYKYNDSDDDKKRYYVNLSGEKKLLNGDLSISIDFKYRVTDNEQKPDNEQKAVRFGAGYKW